MATTLLRRKEAAAFLQECYGASTTATLTGLACLAPVKPDDGAPTPIPGHRRKLGQRDANDLKP